MSVKRDTPGDGRGGAPNAPAELRGARRSRLNPASARYDARMHIVITGHDDVFAAAASIEEAARARGLAVVREDRPIPEIDYSLEDLLGLRRSDIDVAVEADDAAWAATLVAARAASPDVSVEIERSRSR